MRKLCLTAEGCKAVERVEIDALLNMWRDDARICASLSVFNIAGRVKKSYHCSRPYGLIALEIWDNEGNMMLSMPPGDIASIRRVARSSSLEMDVTMRDGHVINLR